MTISLDSFNCRKKLKVGTKTYVYYSPEGRREERPDGRSRPALLAEGAAGEPSALRGRPHRHQGGHPGRRRLAGDQGQVRARNRLPPGPRADAGLHRRPRRRRPRRHARRHEAARRRPQEDQPARSGRPRHRPLGHRRRVRHPEGASKQNVDAGIRSATASATTSCAGARRRSRISASCRPAPASATR